MAGDSGSEVSFDDFVSARAPALLRFAYLLTQDGSLAEDLVQEALLKFHRQWMRGRLAQAPEAYVRRIVVHEFVSWRRRRSSGEVPGRVPERVESDSTEELAQRDLMWRALAELPRRQRAVLVLRYYECLPDAEIAQVLECAASTVRSLTKRALDSLRQRPELLTEMTVGCGPRQES